MHSRFTMSYSLSMTHRVGAKGQVVVPKAIRDQIGLEPGDAVEFSLLADKVLIARGEDRPALGGRYARSGMAARLLLDRESEPE